MDNENLLTQYDAWLDDESPVAALVMRQWLVSVEGKEGIIFPPTYAPPQEGRAKDDWSGYNIDYLPDGSTVCQIDSVGSQANRMEPIFKREKYKHLVPQVIINANGQHINLLDAGHRAADAIVRFSVLKAEFENAYCAIRDNGNALPIAKIAPTSAVFGSWDSRATQTKQPRIVRSVIRAFNVDSLHRSANYAPPIHYVNAGLIETPSNKTQEDALSEMGFNHALSSWSHGGLRLRKTGEIRRDSALNLVAIRSLGTGTNADATKPTEETLKLRRYILGLALIAFTAPQDSFLREGCQLVPDAEFPAKWELVRHDGLREDVQISHPDALTYAKAAADAFGVGENRIVDFDAKDARAQSSKSKEERKAEQKKSKLAKGDR